MTHDKAKVENGVLIVERWIMAALRNHRFFEIGELNKAIAELLVKLNNRPFRKREGTRVSLFRSIDQPALKPLPADRFDLSQWAKARVNIDYHITFDGNFYSVPYNLVHELVEIRSMPVTVEIVLDEAHRICKDTTLPKIMKEGRKFGVVVVAASQGINDFHTDVLGNAGTKVVFRTNYPASRRVSGFVKLRRDRDSAEIIEQLSVGNALVQTPDMQSAKQVSMFSPETEHPGRDVVGSTQPNYRTD
jgi:hypothetical protein